MSDDFSAWLRHAREQAQLSQHELGEIIHVRPATISRWETGSRNPKFSTRVLLEQVLKGKRR